MIKEGYKETNVLKSRSVCGILKGIENLRKEE